MNRVEYKDAFIKALKWCELDVSLLRSSVEILYGCMLREKTNMDEFEILDNYRAMAQETSKSTKVRGLNDLISAGVVERENRHYRLVKE